MLLLHSTNSIAPVAVQSARPAVVSFKAVWDLSLRPGFMHACRMWDIILRNSQQSCRSPPNWASMQVIQGMPNKRTMSALPTAVPIVLDDSSAACSPRLGFPPVPAIPPALLNLHGAAAKPQWTPATDSHARQA